MVGSININSFGIKKEDILNFLNRLQKESGGYSDTPSSAENVRATLSVIKALISLKQTPGLTPLVASYIMSCRDKSGGFSINKASVGSPAPYDTANAIIGLKNMGEMELVEKYKDSAFSFMEQKAENEFDYFMLIAAYEELGLIDNIPRSALDFFYNFLENALYKKDITSIAIASASIMRAGKRLDNEDKIAMLLLNSQNKDGGFGENGESTLFSSYCILRALILLECTPRINSLLKYIESLKCFNGFSDLPNGAVKASSTYIALSILEWVGIFQNLIVQKARSGDKNAIIQWLANGGNPNIADSDGFTVLNAAAAYGKYEIVDILLNHNIEGALHADPKIRYEKADLLPIHLAGQNGNLDTVKILLKANPGDAFEISSINGHTLLLQAAFFGKAAHFELAKYLLDNIDTICNSSSENKKALQMKLLCATNVRNYTPLTMQDLWHNEKMAELFESYFTREELYEQSQSYYKDLLLKIATPQALTEKLIECIEAYISDNTKQDIPLEIDSLINMPQFEINRVGGPLSMTPLIYTISSSRPNEPVLAVKCYCIAEKLLNAGADPCVYEKHPMGVGAVIRASVTNNFKILKLLYSYMESHVFSNEINMPPPINGLTAMHDAVHRALTSPKETLDNHIAQIKWMLERGAQTNIPDNIGQTAYELAKYALDKTSGFPYENAVRVWDAIKGKGYSNMIDPNGLKIIQPFYNLFCADKRDWDKAFETLDDNWKSYDSNDTYRDKAQTRVFLEKFFNGIPDINVKIIQLHVQDDWIFVRSELTGTPVGDFFGVKSTGRPFKIMTVDFNRFVGNKLVELYHCENIQLAISQILGES